MELAIKDKMNKKASRKQCGNDASLLLQKESQKESLPVRVRDQEARVLSGCWNGDIREQRSS